MTNKEFKEYWSKKTLGEVRGYYEDTISTIDRIKKDIQIDCNKLIELDLDNKYYGEKSYKLAYDIKQNAKDIKDLEKMLSTLKPILDKKEAEGINEKEYEDYIANNINIKVLIEAIEKDKQEFINNGSKVIISKRGETKEIILSKQEIDNMYDIMLKELIMILKDNIGNIIEVKDLRFNGNRGMDGIFIGEKVTICINTILAGGYNIQKLHFRTLAYRY